MNETRIRGYALDDNAPAAKLVFINYCRQMHREETPLCGAVVTRLFRLAGSPDPEWVDEPEALYILPQTLGDDLLKAAQERLVMDHTDNPEIRRSVLRVVQAAAGMP